jgi:hypothetical protein
MVSNTTCTFVPTSYTIEKKNNGSSIIERSSIVGRLMVELILVLVHYTKSRRRKNERQFLNKNTVMHQACWKVRPIDMGGGNGLSIE